MSKRKGLCIVTDAGGTSIYDVKYNDKGINDHTTTLSRSDAGVWTAECVGGVVARVHDHGNGIIAKVATSGDWKAILLDYSQAVELYTVLHLHLHATKQSVKIAACNVAKEE